MERDITRSSTDMDIATVDPAGDGMRKEWHGREKSELAELKCDGEVVDSGLVYWRKYQNDVDGYNQTPWPRTKLPQYVSFEPDQGGFNNIR